MAEILEGELTCPRCGASMQRGFLNAGKGPFRWVTRVDENKTVFGGDLVAPRALFWGRRVAPAARCATCHVGVFAYDQQ